MKLIALTGKKRSGKSAAAKVLEQKGFTRLAFADPLKDILSKVYNIPLEALNDPAEKELPRTDLLLGSVQIGALLGEASKYKAIEPIAALNAYKGPLKHPSSYRELLQIVGTDLFRDRISATYWADCLALIIQKLNKKHIVIEDLRFPEEAELVNKLKGKTVLIERPGNNAHDLHISEQVQRLNYDYKIYNRDLEYLKEDIELIASLIGWKSSRGKRLQRQK